MHDPSLRKQFSATCSHDDDGQDAQQDVSIVAPGIPKQTLDASHDTLIATIRHWQSHLGLELKSKLACGQSKPHHDNHPRPIRSHSDPYLLNESRLNWIINSIIIRLLWLGLCKHQNLIPKADLLRWSQTPHAHQQCWAQFQHFNQVSRDLTIKPDCHTSHWISDATFQPILYQVAHLSLHDRYPETVLGMVYEYLLANPITQTSSSVTGHNTVCDQHPLSASHQPMTQKANGIYYTPVTVVENMVEQTLGRYGQDSFLQDIAMVTVLDPACGSGIFLAIAYRWLLKWYRQSGCPGTSLEILQRHIYGVDLDPQAVELTRLSLLLVLWRDDPSFFHAPQADLSANIQWGNAIIDTDVNKVLDNLREEGCDRATKLQHEPYLHPLHWPSAFPTIMEQGGFDIVLGNPPYVDAEWMTRHQPIERRYCASHYQTASGNWDLFCIFCEQALRLCKPNGLHSFIVPNKLTAANYAQETRTLLTIENQLLYLRDYSQAAVFSIAVYPLVYVVQKTCPQNNTVKWERQSGQRIDSQILAYAHFRQPKRPWAIAPNHSLQALVTHIRNQGIPLDNIATVHGAATVAEAYAIKPLLRDETGISATHTSPPGIKFVNSGTIDPYQFLWGQKSMRYLKDRYQAPIIPAELVHQLPPKRLHQANQPKIIVAGMTRGLECAVDQTGEFLAGKSTTVITSAIDLCYLTAILNSRLMKWYYNTEYGGNALNGGYLRIGPPQIKTLPIVVGSDRQQTSLTALVNQLHHYPLPQAKHPDHTEERSTILHQIDQQVCALYGLSEEAIAVLNDHSTTHG